MKAKAINFGKEFKAEMEKINKIKEEKMKNVLKIKQNDNDEDLISLKKLIKSAFIKQFKLTDIIDKLQSIIQLAATEFNIKINDYKKLNSILYTLINLKRNNANVKKKDDIMHIETLKEYIHLNIDEKETDLILLLRRLYSELNTIWFSEFNTKYKQPEPNVSENDKLIVNETIKVANDFLELGKLNNDELEDFLINATKDVKKDLKDNNNILNLVETAVKKVSNEVNTNKLSNDKVDNLVEKKLNSIFNDPLNIKYISPIPMNTNLFLNYIKNTENKTLLNKKRQPTKLFNKKEAYKDIYKRMTEYGFKPSLSSKPNLEPSKNISFTLEKINKTDLKSQIKQDVIKEITKEKDDTIKEVVKQENLNTKDTKEVKKEIEKIFSVTKTTTEIIDTFVKQQASNPQKQQSTTATIVVKEKFDTKEKDKPREEDSGTIYNKSTTIKDIIKEKKKIISEIGLKMLIKGKNDLFYRFLCLIVLFEDIKTLKDEEDTDMIDYFDAYVFINPFTPSFAANLKYIDNKNIQQTITLDDISFRMYNKYRMYIKDNNYSYKKFCAENKIDLKNFSSIFEMNNNSNLNIQSLIALLIIHLLNKNDDCSSILNVLFNYPKQDFVQYSMNEIFISEFVLKYAISNYKNGEFEKILDGISVKMDFKSEAVHAPMQLKNFLKDLLMNKMKSIEQIITLKNDLKSALNIDQTIILPKKKKELETDDDLIKFKQTIDKLNELIPDNDDIKDIFFKQILILIVLKSYVKNIRLYNDYSIIDYLDNSKAFVDSNTVKIDKKSPLFSFSLNQFDENFKMKEKNINLNERVKEMYDDYVKYAKRKIDEIEFVKKQREFKETINSCFFNNIQEPYDIQNLIAIMLYNLSTSDNDTLPGLTMNLLYYYNYNNYTKYQKGNHRKAIKLVFNTNSSNKDIPKAMQGSINYYLKEVKLKQKISKKFTILVQSLIDSSTISSNISDADIINYRDDINKALNELQPKKTAEEKKEEKRLKKMIEDIKNEQQASADDDQEESQSQSQSYNSQVLIIIKKFNKDIDKLITNQNNANENLYFKRLLNLIVLHKCIDKIKDEGDRTVIDYLGPTIFFNLTSQPKNSIFNRQVTSIDRKKVENQTTLGEIIDKLYQNYYSYIYDEIIMDQFNKNLISFMQELLTILSPELNDINFDIKIPISIMLYLYCCYEKIYEDLVIKILSYSNDDFNKYFIGNDVKIIRILFDFIKNDDMGKDIRIALGETSDELKLHERTTYEHIQGTFIKFIRSLFDRNVKHDSRYFQKDHINTALNSEPVPGYGEDKTKNKNALGIITEKQKNTGKSGGKGKGSRGRR